MMDRFFDFVVLHLSESQFVSVVTLLIMWAFIALLTTAWYLVRWGHEGA